MTVSLSNKDLYYKSKGGHIKSIPLHANTTRVSLDYRPLDSIDLEPLRKCPMLRELSLKSCILNSIDLTPIENCTEMTRLDLRGNRLKAVNLSPLENLAKLEYLNIASNGLHKIDLTPLTGLLHLKGLILRGNGLSELDVTPLALSSQLRYLTFGSDVRIVADHLLQHYGPNLVRDNIEIFQESISTAANVVRYLAKSGDCKELQKILLQMLKTPTRIMEKQYHILQVLGLGEFAGLDSPMYKIIKAAPVTDGLEDFIGYIYREIVRLIQSQIDGGGFIAFFDIEKMKETYAAHLIPKILKRRQEEFKELCLYHDKSGIIDLVPMWLTSFGYNMLSALDMQMKVKATDFDKIERALKKVNLKICVSMEAAKESVNISEGLKDFVLSRPV